MFGSHLSIAGSMVNALHEAERLGLDTVQVFTKNQQQWRARPLDPGMVREWRAEVRRLGWDAGGGPGAHGPADLGPAGARGRTVSHASYLINLASPDDELWRKSIDLMTDEIERCEALAIPFLVHHPGAYTTSTREAGFARIGAAYRELFGRTRGYATISCLEGTVGAGSHLGGPFEELAHLRAAIIEATGEPGRIGYCLDTCHAHAFGYDLSRREAADRVLDEFDRVCGLASLRVVHVNDSKGAPGSRRDLHAHIGAGTIGRAPLNASGFAAVVNRPELRATPKILETPKGEDPKGTPYDTLNLRRLKRLIRADREPINTRPGAPRGRSAPRRSTPNPSERRPR